MRSWLLVALSLLLWAALPAHSQTWPSRPVKLVVPFPPGGNTDTTTRIVATALEKVLGQKFIVESKPGASGTIGADYVAKSAPDGYTIGVGTNGPILFGNIFAHAPYRWDTDFIPVSSLTTVPLVLVVHPSIEARTLGEWIDLAKLLPRMFAFATSGAGSTNHLAGELLQQRTGAQFLIVHYSGNVAADNALIGGQVDAAFDQLTATLPWIREGKLRALAITTAKRHPALPDVPTFSELGFDGFVSSSFVGLFAPAGTPKVIVTQLSEAISTVLHDRAVTDRLNFLGADVRASRPEEFTAYLRQEYEIWSAVIARTKADAD